MSTLRSFLLALLQLLIFSVDSVYMNVPFSSPERDKVWLFKSSYGPSIVRVHSPCYQGPQVTPRPELHRYHHRHHSVKPYPVAPSPSEDQACYQTCTDPFTSTPFGSPCGCVFPMKIRLVLDVAPLAVFSEIDELEIEVASETYLKHSQVRIMGVNADGQNQGRTVVDMNLVPLGEKFDNTTAVLLYQKFWHKEVSINRSLFGDYAILYIFYPGIPSSLPPGTLIGSGPLPSDIVDVLPVTIDSINKNEKMDLRTIVVLSSVIVLLVLVGAFSIILKWMKIRRSSSAVGFTSNLNKRSALEFTLARRITSSRSMSFGSTIATSILSVKTFSFSELEKATANFSSQRVLGEGGFGRVYCGILDDGNEVAVKLLTRDGRNGDREFIVEVEMLSRLHHRNLVKLIGICVEGRRRCLVYEFFRNGVWTLICMVIGDINKKSSPLDWEARKKIALGAARGLAYLHEDSNPRVIHRDFKASNVLLEDDFTPKVSDFGLAREATEGSRQISTRVMGTFGYVAPEYAMTGHLLVKSDVYSYGVVLLELLTGRKPVDMSQPSGQENLVTWARPLLASREGLEKLVDPSLAGSCDLDEMAKVAAIASMCVSQEVSKRPFMGEIVQALKLIYNDTNESQKESYGQESEFGGDLVLSDSSFLDGEEPNCITMEYSSGPLAMEERALKGDEIDLPMKHENRSCPLGTKSAGSKLSFSKLTRSRSEHACGTSFEMCWNE